MTEEPSFMSLVTVGTSSNGCVDGRELIRPRLEELAASQGVTVPADLDLGSVGIVVATRVQVESDGFMDKFNIGMVISSTGKETTPYEYGTSRGEALVRTRSRTLKRATPRR